MRPIGELIAYVNVRRELRNALRLEDLLEAGFGFARIKRLRAFGGCLGTERR